MARVISPLTQAHFADITTGDIVQSIDWTTVEPKVKGTANSLAFLSSDKCLVVGTQFFVSLNLAAAKPAAPKTKR